MEAAVGGSWRCLYLPKGNLQPGPKFDYKMAWFQLLHRHAAALLKTGHPVILAGDHNVVPTDEDTSMSSARGTSDEYPALRRRR